MTRIKPEWYKNRPKACPHCGAARSKEEHYLGTGSTGFETFWECGAMTNINHETTGCPSQCKANTYSLFDKIYVVYLSLCVIAFMIGLFSPSFSVIATVMITVLMAICFVREVHRIITHPSGSAMLATMCFILMLLNLFRLFNEK